jgi:hypothetical protein
MDSSTLCNYGHKIGWLHHQKCNLYHANGTIYQNLYTMHNKVFQSFSTGLKVVPKIQTKNKLSCTIELKTWTRVNIYTINFKGMIENKFNLEKRHVTKQARHVTKQDMLLEKTWY